MGAGLNFGARARERAKLFVLLFGASAGILFAACGLDDSALVELGGLDSSISDTGTIVEESGKPIVDSGADVVVCDPETCASYPSICRAGLSNSCGGTLDCTNACPSGQACILDSGTCDGPPVCRDAGAPGGNCGTIVNPGNGLDASCGSCSNGYTCTSSTCGCASSVVCNGTCCSAATDVCNTSGGACCVPDPIATTCGQSCGVMKTNNCGKSVTCPSTCTGSLECAPSTHTCDAPPTCTNMGQNGGNCGTLTGSDGLTTNCGTCTGTNETCTNNLCGCPNTTCSGACCLAGQVCNPFNNNTCCTPSCDGYSCGGSDGCGGTCGCTLNPGYNTCYVVAGVCSCALDAGCSACPAGYKTCTGTSHQACVPNADSCPGP